MPEVELSAGTIEYEDAGGSGPVVVLIHGVVMDGTLWRHVAEDLAKDHRVIVPTLPLGAHHRPMKDDADLSLLGIARLVGEFLERLDLRDVTLVNSDWGGPQLLLAEGPTDRIARAVITSCEAFDNYPPGIPGRMLGMSARMPGGLQGAFGMLRIRPARRLPFTWGHMTKRPIGNEVMDAWFEPVLSDSKIRRDFKKYVRSVPPKKELLEWSERLRSFDKPALVVWAAEDKLMPPEHGRRLAEMLPQGRLVEIPDSYTLIPEDQPAVLATEVRQFAATGAAREEPVRTE